jgi:hypothetical protein
MTQSDLSQRFILPPDSVFLANLAALWQSDPTLAELIESLDDPGPYPVHISKSGLPTLSLPTSDGRIIFLHSRHDPRDEAATLIEGLELEKKTTFYIHGLGLAYHLELLFDRASNEAIFCVFEPDLRLIRTALENRELSRLLTSHRIHWFHRADKAELFSRLTPHTALISVGIESVSLASAVSREPKFHQQITVWLDEFAAFVRTNMNTLLGNSSRTARNIARNIGWYAATPGLARLRERYRNSAAIIVSAGPSLRKNKHLLAGLEQNAALIAVQTTLQPLLEMGVQPQFVTSLDYHEICTRFFENLPRNLRTELIAEPKAASAIFSMIGGPVTLIGNDFAEGLLREMNLQKPALPSGATVAHLAFYLAECLGCNPIIFVGQDLGFSDGLCYTPGTSYEDVWRPEISRFCSVEMKQWEHIVRDKAILRQIPDQNGHPMYTEERLFAYLNQFERDFAKSKARIIDATEGGARKRGAEIMPLSRAIAEFCASPLPQVDLDPPALRWELLDQCRTCIDHRSEEAHEIKNISEETLPLLEEIHDHLDNQPRVNRAIGKIDRLRARMEKLGRTYELVMQFTQTTEMKKFEEDRRLVALRLEGTDKQRHQVRRDIENVRAVIAAATDFQELMHEVSENLSRMEQIMAVKEAA